MRYHADFESSNKQEQRQEEVATTDPRGSDSGPVDILLYFF